MAHTDSGHWVNITQDKLERLAQCNYEKSVGIRAGAIGEPQRRVEIEPIEEPASEPVHEPAAPEPVREPETVPA